MPHHYAHSIASRDLDLERIERRSDPEVYDEFLARRYEDTGGKPVCPHCGGQEVYKLKCREALKCKPCKRQFTPRIRTEYYKRKLSLYKLDKAAAIFALRAKGICAIELSHAINVQYKTAYRLLQKFRNAVLPRASLERFVDDVKHKRQEVLKNGLQFDGAEVGGFVRPKNVKKTENDHRKVPYRSDEREAAVVVIEPGGRVRVALFKHEGGAVPLLRRSAKRYTVVYCDMGSSWNDLRVRFKLRRVNHTYEYANAESNTNVAESFWALVRMLERGIYHHISGVHVLSYLAEAAWRRENYRSSDEVKYNKVLQLLLKPIPAAPKFNRNVKGSMRREGRRSEYFAARDAVAAEARALAFAN